MKIHTKIAKKLSYGGKRPYKDIKYIVIHFTDNKGDTAKNNAVFYAKGNTREAGAHFFVDSIGEIWKSVNLNRIAWSVGGAKYDDECRAGGGKYYGHCTNYNSVSIELCNLTGAATWEQMKATRELVLYIRKKCPNAKTIIRHWDVNGKPCPAPFKGKSNEKWRRFRAFITTGYCFKAKVIKKAAVRSSAKVTATNRIGTAKVGHVVEVGRIAGKWARLKNKTASGKYKYIALSKLKEIK